METYESTKKNNLEIITEIGNLNAFINYFLDPLIMILLGVRMQIVKSN